MQEFILVICIFLCYTDLQCRDNNDLLTCNVGQRKAQVGSFSVYKVNHPAAGSGAWKLKRPKGRGIDPRGIRQIAMLAWLFS